MKILSKPAKNTLLEMISRYEISNGTKFENGKVRLLWNGPTMQVLASIVLTTLCVYLSIFASFDGKDILILTTFVTSVMLVIKNLVNADYSKFLESFNFFVTDNIKRSYFKVRRFVKLRNNLKFEAELKDNYVEIKDWCLRNGQMDKLRKMIDEMQFPNISSNPIPTSYLRELLSSDMQKNKEYISEFVGVDELEKVALDGESRAIFFVGNK